MAKVITATQAAELINDNVTLGFAVSALAGWPEEVALAIRERFLKTGHPRGLTLTHGPGAGDTKTRGECSLAEEGLVKRLIVGHVGTSPRMARMAEENKVECYFLPQGVMCQLFNEIGRKGPGVLSKVGLGTFVDPRVEGGRLMILPRKISLKSLNLKARSGCFTRPILLM